MIKPSGVIFPAANLVAAPARSLTTREWNSATSYSSRVSEFWEFVSFSRSLWSSSWVGSWKKWRSFEFWWIPNIPQSVDYLPEDYGIHSRWELWNFEVYCSCELWATVVVAAIYRYRSWQQLAALTIELWSMDWDWRKVTVSNETIEITHFRSICGSERIYSKRGPLLQLFSGILLVKIWKLSTGNTDLLYQIARLMTSLGTTRTTCQREIQNLCRGTSLQMLLMLRHRLLST